ncbi:hypothetical protein SALWKB12_0026 [Snodgrassella communis]|uniref:Uncharacterized protein n=1 Tax=Snodgrassella communis TaxID=2946699 RepID=A0A837AGR9_9NEIS|nr:hypothetical protein SALWKB12_0026 [Snodgrassella communis]KDN14409.1 hypothetical protein SALWKB29_1498 [Snodgrassella communis]
MNGHCLLLRSIYVYGIKNTFLPPQMSVVFNQLFILKVNFASMYAAH